ncbi:uncharacterized protein LOC100901208 [Galendromus occidentalis]|uniref:Uncharacterized protein LOC100901208 n=1 Tax=Galendromus occidentalis TaxID=34638 RepID=A0AAJ6QSX6_9ACAR|nr:uncharacterized protein LOC100901208 [Galendromus occidentalis]
MEINRTLSLDVIRIISDEALRQTYEYLHAPPTRFSFKTSCCGKIRQNSDLIDPGYYLNGGPSCEQSGLSCDTPDEHEIEAFADGLVPGSFVYAPRTWNRFWPAMVDFCHEDSSHFAVFRLGGSHCCQPYAYYVSFIPDMTQRRLGGWFSAKSVVPFDTTNAKDIDLDLNVNDPHFDTSYDRANRYYTRSLTARMERFSLVCHALQSTHAKYRPNQAGLAKRFTSSNYQRYEAGEDVSLTTGASTSTLGASADANASGSGSVFRRKTPTKSRPDRAVPLENGELNFLRWDELPSGQTHIHASEDTPPPKIVQPAVPMSPYTFTNPTEYWRCGAHEVTKRAAIRAAMKAGLQEIRIFKSDEII